MLKRPWIAVCFALSIAVFPGVRAQEKNGHFADIKRILCAEGAERYLPGDYYFCAGNKALQGGNTRKALEMYEVAAGWGDKRAMFNLGLLLLRGEGVPKNEPLGLAWLALAAERPKDRIQREVLAGAWKSARPETRDAANALWNQMKLKYADRVVLVRAQERYERETRELRRALQFDPFVRFEIGFDGSTSSGLKALAKLDEAAAETILRPLPTAKKNVNVGAPEMVRDSVSRPKDPSLPSANQ